MVCARDEARINGAYPDLTQPAPTWEGTPSNHKEVRPMSSTSLKRTLALALAGGSLAIGVPVALAGTGGGDAAPASGSAPASGFIQEEGQHDRPDREDCPERDGRDGGQGEGEDSSAGSTAAPSV
jgi:hypothetical protein